MPLLTSQEVARLLGCSARTVHRLVAAGHLSPSQKLAGPNGALLFDRKAVQAYRRSREQAA